MLKSLSIQGFKSFASRAVLELSPGIAAVVGPNGSGKSNIADAIRWALGEQSIKALRGTRLEDVIFAGSDTKRPVGMAEVSLTFDNREGRIPLEYSEVTVTRRVYRSGESDFSINRTPCRLRDIHELFMDTGIGRGSLALIGQGEIDTVLSAHPEDRRAFLEEVAGITRYRSRKQEAQIKLAKTEENLVRARDIAREVESRLDPLARQAELAREYKANRSRLDRIEVSLLLADHRRLRSAHEESSRRMRRIEAERTAARDRLAALHRKAAECAARLDALDAAMEQGRDEVEGAKDAEIAARHRGERARDRLGRAERDESEGRRRLAAAREKLARLEEERRAAEAARAEIVAQIDARSKELGSLKEEGLAEERELEALEAELGRGRRELARLRESIVAGEGRIEAIDRESEHQEEEAGAQTARRKRLDESVEAHEGRLQAAKARLAEVEADDAKARARLKEVQAKLSAARAAEEEAEARLAEVRRAVRDLEAKANALAEMEAAREGYYRGVRAVLAEAPERGWKLVGAVAEILKAAPAHETAIEVALGEAVQFIVAETDRDAKLAIEHLKATKGGRATFLPLDTLRPRPLEKETAARIQRSAGVVGIASKLVTVSRPCRPVADYLLGRVVVTEDLDAAIRLAREARGFARAVSLDGDVVVPGGTMTGGTKPGRSQGLIARGRRLEELREALRAHERAEALQRAERDRHEQAIRALRDELEQAEEIRRRLELERLAADRDVREIEAGLERLRAERREVDALVDRLLSRRTERAAERGRLAERLDAEKKESARLAAEIDGLEAELGRRKKAREGYVGRVQALEVEVAGLSQKGEERAREADRIAAEIREAGEAVTDEEARLAALAEERSRAKAEIGEAELEAERAEKRREQAAARLEAMRSERRSLRDEAEAVSAKVSEAQALFDEIQEEYAQVRAEIERFEADIGRVSASLAERGVDPERRAMASEPGEDEDEAALLAEAKSLKRKLEAIGPVNVSSIDEYEAVRERHRFLTEQVRDLEEAKAQLEEAIRRLDRESREKLRAVFDRVRQAFAEVFARLFGGGKADLSFLDPEDPLESGIEIFVQPPGKTLQNLLALSGGERALSAIALLFAVLAVRPSPFCVLDEIDAALDDHNLDRFCGLLKEYARSTQFLIITHRQATMETADSLFGVTMEESGVSSLVSLKLEEARPA